MGHQVLQSKKDVLVNSLSDRLANCSDRMTKILTLPFQHPEASVFFVRTKRVRVSKTASAIDPMRILNTILVMAATILLFTDLLVLGCWPRFRPDG